MGLSIEKRKAGGGGGGGGGALLFIFMDFVTIMIFTQQIYLSFKMFSFLLTHFSSTVGFLTFSGGIEIEHWAKIG